MKSLHRLIGVNASVSLILYSYYSRTVQEELTHLHCDISLYSGCAPLTFNCAAVSRAALERFPRVSR